MLQPARIDCNALLRFLHPLVRGTLRDNIELRMDLDPGLWPAIADPGQLETAILNLALNAQDAMPDGGCLTIATANAPLDARYAVETLAARGHAPPDTLLLNKPYQKTDLARRVREALAARPSS